MSSDDDICDELSDDSECLQDTEDEWRYETQEESSDSEYDTTEGDIEIVVPESPAASPFPPRRSSFRLSQPVASTSTSEPPKKKVRFTPAASGTPSAASGTPSAASGTPSAASVTPSAASVTPATSTRTRRTQPVPTIHNFNKNTLISPNKTRWNTEPLPVRGRRPFQPDNPQTFTHYQDFTPGPTQRTEAAVSPLQFFELFMTDEMVAKIVVHTNDFITREQNHYKHQTATNRTTGVAETKAFLGILIMTGVMKDNHIPTHDMWIPETGVSMYRAAMSERRFAFLLRALRFDDRATRQSRQGDRFTYIRQLWEAFIGHCKEMYVPGEDLTIDEQLLAFRGRCPFKMYIPSKPAK